MLIPLDLSEEFGVQEGRIYIPVQEGFGGTGLMH